MSHGPENLLLQSLSIESRGLILAISTHMSLPLRTELYRPEQTPAHAYFLTSGIASVVISMPTGETIEVGVIGREGISGGLHLLGPGLDPTHCFMQLAGSAYQVPFPELSRLFESSEEVRKAILKFIQEQTLCLSQIAGCHRLHKSEERLARWLLMVQDRTGSDVLHLNQEFLAQMLSAQRTTVTAAAVALKRRGLIDYQRGRVNILNREQLEAAACNCYPITKQLLVNLYAAGRPA